MIKIEIEITHHKNQPYKAHKDDFVDLNKWTI
jgi:hypothetical protein